MAFKYYKDQGNQVYAFTADGSEDGYIRSGLIPITEAEADALRVVPPVVPTKVEMVQARLALLQRGYLPKVEGILAGISGVEGQAARIEWEFRGYVERDHQLVTFLKAQIPLTEVQLDDLFALAGTL